jgi:hypothetical protein
MKTEALKIQEKLIHSEALNNADRNFLIGFIYFALEFQDYIKGTTQPRRE